MRSDDGPQTASVSAITYRFSEKFSGISGITHTTRVAFRFRTRGIARAPAGLYRRYQNRCPGGHTGCYRGRFPGQRYIRLA